MERKRDYLTVYVENRRALSVTLLKLSTFLEIPAYHIKIYFRTVFLYISNNQLEYAILKTTFTKDLCINVHLSFLNDSLQIEITQISTNSQMSEQHYIHTRLVTFNNAYTSLYKNIFRWSIKLMKPILSEIYT